jgi:hypothetical protein
MQQMLAQKEKELNTHHAWEEGNSNRGIVDAPLTNHWQLERLY